MSVFPCSCQFFSWSIQAVTSSLYSHFWFCLDVQWCCAFVMADTGNYKCCWRETVTTNETAVFRWAPRHRNSNDRGGNNFMMHWLTRSNQRQVTNMQKFQKVRQQTKTKKQAKILELTGENRWARCCWQNSWEVMTEMGLVDNLAKITWKRAGTYTE